MGRCTLPSDATPSIIRTHTLLDGSLRNAGRAAAAAVVELAIAGYLTIAPDDDRYQSVLLVRTDKPMDALLPEQAMLLEALFGAEAKAGTAAYLRARHQIPVAQTIMAVTRQSLLQDGFITSSKPQDLYRKLRGGFLLVAITSWGLVAVLSRSFDFVILATVIWIVINAFFSTFVTDRLKVRRVKRTPKGNRHTKKLIELRSQLVAGSRPAKLVAANTLLPYEVLWHRFQGQELPSLENMPTTPSWWRGHDWPNEANCLARLLQVVEAALNQSGLVDGSGFEPTPPERFDYFAWLEEKGDQILDIRDTVTTIGGLDLSDWGGDGHDGGDGGHGDGSGDGHGDGGHG